MRLPLSGDVPTLISKLLYNQGISTNWFFAASADLLDVRGRFLQSMENTGLIVQSYITYQHSYSLLLMVAEKLST